VNEQDTKEVVPAPAKDTRPSEKLRDKDKSYVHAPGVERRGEREVKKEINPNTE
jgi:hypothetical protein